MGGENWDGVDRREGQTGREWSFKKELSIGDLLAIGIALISIMSAYATLDRRVAVLEQQYEQQKTNDAEIKGRLSAIDAKLDRLIERGLIRTEGQR